MLRQKANLSICGLGAAPPDAVETFKIVWHKIIGNFHFCKQFNEQYNDHIRSYIHIYSTATLASCS